MLRQQDDQASRAVGAQNQDFLDIRRAARTRDQEQAGAAVRQAHLLRAGERSWELGLELRFRRDDDVHRRNDRGAPARAR